MRIFRNIALGGNALFILWIAYNAIDEGFAGVRPVEAASLIGLICLLALNIALLRKQS